MFFQGLTLKKGGEGGVNCEAVGCVRCLILLPERGRLFSLISCLSVQLISLWLILSLATVCIKEAIADCSPHETPKFHKNL